MGSKSSSSSSSRTTSNQYDQRVGAADNGVAIGGSNPTLNVDATTPEAWEFGETALGFGGEALNVVNGVFQETISNIIPAALGSVGDSLSFAREVQSSETENANRDLIRVGLPVVAGAVVAAVVLPKVLK